MVSIPTLHLNGSSGDTLLDNAHDAVRDLDVLIDGLRMHPPHARDFYVQGEGAYRSARAEHEARIAALTAILAEYREIKSGIRRQLAARMRAA